MALLTTSTEHRTNEKDDEHTLSVLPGGIGRSSLTVEHTPAGAAYDIDRLKRLEILCARI